MGVLRGKIHISAHGSADKIITMVTTGCGSSHGTLGESRTDTNGLKVHTHKHRKSKYSHTNFHTQVMGGP